MRVFILLLSGILLTLTGCNPTKAAFSRGDYDAAILSGIRRLHKKPGDSQTLLLVAESYRLANNRDFERIRELENRQEDARRWESIHQVYRSLESRQSRVRNIPRPRGELISTDLFEFRDYSVELDQSRNQAVIDLYASGMRLLSTGQKSDAREAFSKFRSVLGLNASYKDAAERMEDARVRGTNFVVIQIAPAGGLAMPVSFERELSQLNLSPLNREWVEYHLGESYGITYDYFIEIEVEGLTVSPERENRSSRIEKAEIEDGWEYKKNADGSVARDSSGNRIKIPVMREVRATVSIIEQTRQASANAQIRLINSAGQPMAQHALVGNHVWRHTYGTSRGDVRALSKESQALIQRRAVNYPSTEEMILQTAVPLRNQVQSRLQSFRSQIR
jgi:hypothetical protein